MDFQGWLEHLGTEVTKGDVVVKKDTSVSVLTIKPLCLRAESSLFLSLISLQELILDLLRCHDQDVFLEVSILSGKFNALGQKLVALDKRGNFLGRDALRESLVPRGNCALESRLGLDS